MSAADELRKAIEVLRCDHRFPINPPSGSIYGPGCCVHCGVSYRFEKPVADWLVEPLADLLEEEIRQYDLPPCETLARAIRGGDAP